MKFLRNKRGITLIEMVIALAIFGLISVSFLGMFTSGFKGVTSAGKYSKAGYVGQKAMENTLGGIPVAEPYVTSSTVSSVPVSMNFAGTSVTVTGKVELINYNDGKYSIELATFIPD